MENTLLKVNVSNKGAELTSIQSKVNQFEFLWQANPTIWGRHAPILFPIVGKVKDNLLRIHNAAWPMSQHGFARDQEFELVTESADEVWLELNSNSATQAIFPYSFCLQIGYVLNNTTLSCIYKLKNTSSEPLFFSIGAHPGFNLPVKDLSEYTITFDTLESDNRWLLDDGLFNSHKSPVFNIENGFKLQGDSFKNDAIVFKNIQSNGLTLKHVNSNFAIHLNYPGFEHLGIWSQKDCQQFICLEPWCGHADPISGHNDISQKEGIHRLDPGGLFNRQYDIQFSEAFVTNI